MLKHLLVFFFLMTSSWAKEPQGIREVINDYFQGYQFADVALIKKSFHPDTQLLSSEGGKLDRTNMKDWIESLEYRRMHGDVRRGRLTVHSIDETGDTAAAKLSIQFVNFTFTDYLSLLRIGRQWIIVGKIYHFKKTRE